MPLAGGLGEVVNADARTYIVNSLYSGLEDNIPYINRHHIDLFGQLTAYQAFFDVLAEHQGSLFAGGVLIGFCISGVSSAKPFGLQKVTQTTFIKQGIQRVAEVVTGEIYLNSA